MEFLPHRAKLALAEMLDKCAEIRPGQRVLILAYVDGLYGGDNLIDETVIGWIQYAVKERGASTYILWVNEDPYYLRWNFPPVVKAAMRECDVMINNTMDLAHEENVEFKQFIWNEKKLMVRNFAVTAELLCTTWAATPYELLEKIRYKLCEPIKEGMDFSITDPNGTNIRGRIAPAYHPAHPWFTSYTVRRKEIGYYRPWPEWVTPIIRAADVEGVFVFSLMLSWWSRVMGLSPYLKEPITLYIKKSRIEKIEGGKEAIVLTEFLRKMEDKLGEGVYAFNAFHFGVHPYAKIPEHVCPHLLYRRVIEHSHIENIHFHIGAPTPNEKFPYWMHCTGDIRSATVQVGGRILYKDGWPLVLEDQDVSQLMEKFERSVS